MGIFLEIEKERKIPPHTLKLSTALPSSSLRTKWSHILKYWALGHKHEFYVLSSLFSWESITCPEQWGTPCKLRMEFASRTWWKMREMCACQSFPPDYPCLECRIPPVLYIIITQCLEYGLVPNKCFMNICWMNCSSYSFLCLQQPVQC